MHMWTCRYVLGTPFFFSAEGLRRSVSYRLAYYETLPLLLPSSPFVFSLTFLLLHLLMIYRHTFFFFYIIQDRRCSVLCVRTSVTVAAVEKLILVNNAFPKGECSLDRLQGEAQTLTYFHTVFFDKHAFSF